MNHAPWCFKLSGILAGVAGALLSKLCIASDSAGGVTYFLRKKAFGLSKFCSVELEKNVKADVGYIVVFLEKFKVKFLLGKKIKPALCFPAQVNQCTCAFWCHSGKWRPIF